MMKKSLLYAVLVGLFIGPVSLQCNNEIKPVKELAGTAQAKEFTKTIDEKKDGVLKTIYEEGLAVAKETGKFIGVLPIVKISSTIIHELGHATVGRLLGFTIEVFGLESFGLDGGFVQMSPPAPIKNIHETLKLIPVALAGPLAGSLFSYGVFKKIKSKGVRAAALYCLGIQLAQLVPVEVPEGLPSNKFQALTDGAHILACYKCWAMKLNN